MIIPHIEDNLDRGRFDAEALFPSQCPCCGKPVRIRRSDNNGNTETLCCDNKDCAAQTLRKFVHFVGKKAMDIEGLSEATLEKFIAKGWLNGFADIYRLDQYEREIQELEGFGVKSWERLNDAIQQSRNTTFERFIISMDIPMIGRSASRELYRYFNGDLNAFEDAVRRGFNFTQLKDFGETLHNNIHAWFKSSDNLKLWKELQTMVSIEDKNAAATTETAINPFTGRTIVITGTLQSFTRNSINAKIEELGAKAGSAVTKNTDYLICGDKAGSKLTKAQELGVTVLTEQEFLNMVHNA